MANLSGSGSTFASRFDADAEATYCERVRRPGAMGGVEPIIDGGA